MSFFILYPMESGALRQYTFKGVGVVYFVSVLEQVKPVSGITNDRLLVCHHNL